MTVTQPELKLDTKLLLATNQIMRAIDHPVRQKIVCLLHNGGEMSVTEISTKLGPDHTTTTYHLAVLSEEKLLNSERRGNFVYYSLNHDRIRELQKISRRLTERVK